jgi:hypothetical protein
MSDEATRITGSLPSGPEFAASISRDVIALRVRDRVCMAAPRWMTTEQALEAASALTCVAGGAQ